MNASVDFDPRKLFPLPRGMGARLESSQRVSARQQANTLVGTQVHHQPVATTGNLTSFLALRGSTLTKS